MHWIILALILLPTFFWLRHVIKQKDGDRRYMDTEARDAVTVLSVVDTEARDAVTVLSAVGVAVLLAVWAGVFHASCTFVKEFESVRETVTRARQDHDPLDKEMEGITRMLIEENKELALRKYYNQNWFLHLATTDSVDKLEPIR